ncbi:hypothetical protein L6R50_24830 [Myxococcota bacterium]|nr:hypothetical protein [Myxococcota bacterium]
MLVTLAQIRRQVAFGDVESAGKALERVHPRQRDAEWEETARACCRGLRRKEDFTAALRLAATGSLPGLAGERAWACLGLGRPLPADAPEAVRAAERLLEGRGAGPKPPWPANDRRRKVVELAWDLMAGDVASAEKRAANRLPPRELARIPWRGLVHLAAGREIQAAEDLHDLPEPLGSWSCRRLGHIRHEGPAERYADALEHGDEVGAARALVPGAVSEADLPAARIAAAAALASVDRGAAHRHLDALADPFDRALWKARLGLVPAARGWAEVARHATGPRAPAAPLARLRAALALRTEGKAAEAQGLLPDLQDVARRFPKESAALQAGDATDALLMAARAAPGNSQGWSRALAAAISRSGPEAGLRIGVEAWAHECREPLATALAALVPVLRRDPARAVAALAALDLPVPGALWPCLAFHLMEAGSGVTDLFDLAHRRLTPHAAGLMHAVLGDMTNLLDGDGVLYAGDPVIRDYWMRDPRTLAAALLSAGSATVRRVGEQLRKMPPSPERDRLVVAMVEGALGAEEDHVLAAYVPSPLLTPAGDLGTYVKHLLGVRGPRAAIRDPALAAALRSGKFVFAPPPHEFGRCVEEAADLHQGIVTQVLFGSPSPSGPAPAPRPAGKKDGDKKKKAKRKAEKAARRKNR